MQNEIQFILSVDGAEKEQRIKTDRFECIASQQTTWTNGITMEYNWTVYGLAKIPRFV